jgi:hypothetical protein
MNSTLSTETRSNSFFAELKLSEIDLLETYLEICATLDIVARDDPFWMTLGIRLNITPLNHEQRED